MKPEELEELLSRHPDLAPSPDLEARIVAAARRRTAGRRRFPALIPAAAAVLFVVGVVVSMISTLSTPAGKGNRDSGPFVVQFPGANVADVVSQIPQVKDRKIVFAGPTETPWGPVLQVHRACIKAGISQVEWRIADKSLKVEIPPPPTPARPGAPEVVRLEDITVILVREKGVLVRRIGNRKPVESDEELMHLVLRMEADYRKAGKTEFPVFIDANANVLWTEVAHVLEMCAKEGFGPIHLDPPTPPIKIGEPIWTPDKRVFPEKPQDK